MSTFNIPNTFVNGTTIDADEHNDNWVAIKSYTEGVAAGTNLDPSSVGTTNLVDGAVTTAKLADSAVTTAKLANDSVTAAKIVDGTVGSAELAANSVTTAKITDANVTTAKIADANVTTAKIADSNVTTAKIADSAVTSAKIADLTIVNGDISATAAIAYSKLTLSNSIVADDFAAAAKPIIICTSTTRPTTMVAGQVIYETDTTRIYVSTTTLGQWEYVSGPVGATVSGSAAIANTVTGNLSYSSETYDSDGFIPASGTTFTIPNFSGLNGTYYWNIDITSASDMGGGFGSKLELVMTARTYAINIIGTAANISWIAPMSATNTALFRILNSTGASVTYSYAVTMRMLGR